MAINPKCDACNAELTEFGGILLSPPNAAGEVMKYHLCVGCYAKIAATYGLAGPTK
jgi:hypothetical protein